MYRVRKGRIEPHLAEASVRGRDPVSPAITPPGSRGQIKQEIEILIHTIDIVYNCTRGSIAVWVRSLTFSVGTNGAMYCTRSNVHVTPARRPPTREGLQTNVYIQTKNTRVSTSHAPGCPVRPERPRRPTGPVRPMSTALHRRTLVCFVSFINTYIFNFCTVQNLTSVFVRGVLFCENHVM